MRPLAESREAAKRAFEALRNCGAGASCLEEQTSKITLARLIDKPCPDSSADDI